MPESFESSTYYTVIQYYWNNDTIRTTGLAEEYQLKKYNLSDGSSTDARDDNLNVGKMGLFRRQ